MLPSSGPKHFPTAQQSSSDLSDTTLRAMKRKNRGFCGNLTDEDTSFFWNTCLCVTTVLFSAFPPAVTFHNSSAIAVFITEPTTVSGTCYGLFRIWNLLLLFSPYDTSVTLPTCSQHLGNDAPYTL